MGIPNQTKPSSLLLLLIPLSFLVSFNAGNDTDTDSRKLLRVSTEHIFSSPPPPPPSAPPPSISDEKPLYSPFKPNILVLIGLLTGTFSITFLLLLYAKQYWKRSAGNLVVIGRYTTNNPTTPPNPARKNSGINQSVIDSLPIFKFGSLKGKKATQGLECAVCLNKFETTEFLKLLPKCKHAFHVECVDTWLDAHSTCPLCRYRVDPEDVLLLIEEDEENVDGDIDVVRRVSGRHSSVGEKRTGDEMVTVGCFDRVRKDGLLLPEKEEKVIRFGHRIVVGKERWSDVQPSDLLYLRSEMIVSENRRYSVAAALPSELKRYRDRRRFRK